jgi:iron complex outermembrane receptor protein
MSTKRVSSTLMMLFVLGSSMNAFAQNNDVLDENFVLDEMVVSATRSEKKLLDTAASVSVITDKDLDKMHINNLDEAFVKIPGVYVGRLSGIGSTTSQTVMRGVNAANSVAVLVDGVQVNDSYNGSVTWSAIPVDMVKRVEVLRGPASVLYGGNALAGVINIITKDVDKTSVNLKLSYGSNNTQNHSLYVAGKASDKLDFNVNYEKKKTDGYITDPVLSSKAVFGAETTTTNTGAKRWIIGNKGKRQWDENTVGVGFKYHFDESKSLALDFTKNEYEYSYSAPTSYFGDDIIKKAGTYFSTPGEKASNKYNMTYNDSENGWKAVVGYSDQYKQHDTSISKATDSSKPNTRFSFDLQKNQTISANNNAVFGLNYRKDEMDATVYKLADKFNSDSKIAVDSMASGTNKSFSAYVMDEHKFSERWTATAGLRYDKWSTDGRILLPNKTEAINYDESTYDNWSPSLSVMYKPEADSSVYLSWGKAFEAPSLYRMYSSSYSSNVYNIANPNLKPQKAETFELGYKKDLNNKSAIGVSVYDTKYKGLLYKNSLGVVDGMNATCYQNAGEAEAKGFELELNHNFDDKWSAFLNYTYQNPVIKKALKATEKDKYVTAIPKEVFRAGVTYSDDKWSGMLTGEYISKRFSKTDNSDTVNGVYGSYDPYFIMNMDISYSFNKNYTLTASVNNILDRDFFNYYYQPGRTYSVELNYRF